MAGNMSFSIWNVNKFINASAEYRVMEDPRNETVRSLLFFAIAAMQLIKFGIKEMVSG